MSSINIKVYNFEELTEKNWSDLVTTYNKIRKETDTWLDKTAVSISDFKQLVDTELFYMAVDEKEQLLGFLSIYLPDTFIHLFFIDATLQNRGIGSQLLSKVEANLSDRELSLKCLCFNKPAISFYTKHGFKIIETHEENSQEGYHLMRKISIK